VKIIASAAVLVLVIVLAFLSTGGGSGSSSAAVSPAASSSSGAPATPADSSTPSSAPFPDEARRIPGDPYAMGKVDAPVVMVVWSDFQCPFCGHFARETEPTLVKQFVDAGVLRIEWRDFPYLGKESQLAAVAGRAAAAQGKFWQFHDLVYAHEHQVNHGDLSAAHLREYASAAGLGLARYDADVKANRGADKVQADLSEGVGLGITGTPAFLINGQPVLGAQPTATFVAMIQQAAAAAK
ncbi:MAG TPA: thioredoxin domain-containing protein, partial [Propionibacteriaceae bacterium]|nr:thioredoxin domain-containing protein [Propionibacteriaceae bacterium]